MLHALGRLPADRRRVVVQAGGNCGVWPLWLANHFETVLTFEPDCENFYCLVGNTGGMNVLAYQAALGADRGWIRLNREPGNCGAHFMDAGTEAPVLRLDDFALPNLDFLCLDVEGAELLAINGALDTITRHHPVIQVEDKGLSTRYGYRKGEIETFLASFGYHVIARPHRDVVLAWQP